MQNIEKVLREIKDELAALRMGERELERNVDKRFLELHEKIHNVSERLSVDVAGLKTSATIWGGIAGFLPGVLFFIFDILKKH